MAVDKICTKCLINKDAQEFPTGRNQCTKCRTALAKEYRKKNPKIAGKHALKWRQRFPDRALDSRLKHEFNIGIKEYNKILVSQDYRCAICNIHESEGVRRLSVDHCHTTGVIRGLLCGRCNTGLGLFKDNPKFLLEAVRYLNDSGL